MPARLKASLREQLSRVVQQELPAPSKEMRVPLGLLEQQVRVPVVLLEQPGAEWVAERWRSMNTP